LISSVAASRSATSSATVFSPGASAAALPASESGVRVPSPVSVTVRRKVLGSKLISLE
jgi:hypothetical protein